MSFPPPSGTDPLAPVRDEGWFHDRAAEVDRLRLPREAKGSRALKVAGALAAAAFLISAINPVASLLWFPAIAVGIAAFAGYRPSAEEQAICNEVQRAALWEEVLACGRATRASGPPVNGNTADWHRYINALTRWRNHPTVVTFIPDHPFWSDPVKPNIEALWQRSIANPLDFYPEVTAMFQASRQRHDAWFANLPAADPSTYMAIRQIRHQREMEHQAQLQTAAAETTAAAALDAAAHARQIATDSARAANAAEQTARNTAATARELEWRRRFGPQN